jgi:glycine cleavage system H protein
MEFLLSAFEWVAVVAGGLLIRAGVAVAVLAAIVAVVLPVMLAFEGGRRLVRRARGLEDVHGFEWRRALRYAPAHLWVAERGPAVRLGLDAMAARVLLNARHVQVPAPGSRIAAGGALARVTAGGREVTLPAPVAGVVTGVNRQLDASPDLAVREPYSGGWLVELRPDTRDYASLPRAARAREWFRGEAAKLTFALEHAHGYAAADGGVPIAPDHQLLGDDDVERLAVEFLGATVAAGARG